MRVVYRARASVVQSTPIFFVLVHGAWPQCKDVRTGSISSLAAPPLRIDAKGRGGQTRDGARTYVLALRPRTMYQNKKNGCGLNYARARSIYDAHAQKERYGSAVRSVHAVGLCVTAIIKNNPSRINVNITKHCFALHDSITKD